MMLVGSKQSMKKPIARPATSYKPGGEVFDNKVSRADVAKFSKKVEQLKEEFQPMAFRKQQEIMGCLQQIMELMKEE